MIELLSFLVAGVLGFASHRASLCTVGAVAELLHSKHAHILGSFVKASLWALALSLTITWIWPGQSAPTRGYVFSMTSLLGGFLFGVGAAINGGCTISTLRHLAEGHLSFLGTLIGFCLGVAAGRLAPAPEAATIVSFQPDTWHVIMVAGIWAWGFWVVFRLFRSRPAGLPLITAERYRLSTSALILGLGGGTLLTLHGSWSYTSTLRVAVGLRPLHAVQLGLFVALLAGMLLSSWLRGSIRLHPDSTRAWLARIAGGFSMGAGFCLVPGGNATLLLMGIPSLSPHAVPAYGAILVGIAVTLVLLRSRMRVRCAGDICRFYASA